MLKADSRVGGRRRPERAVSPSSPPRVRVNNGNKRERGEIQLLLRGAVVWYIHTHSTLYRHPSSEGGLPPDVSESEERRRAEVRKHQAKPTKCRTLMGEARRGKEGEIEEE